MKNLFKSKEQTHNTNIVFAHISYHISEECMNKDAYITCHKCGKCGRKFTKTWLLKK